MVFPTGVGILGGMVLEVTRVISSGFQEEHIIILVDS